MEPIIIIVAVAVFLVAGAIGVVFFIRKLSRGMPRGPRVVDIEATPSTPFKMAFKVPESTRYGIFLEYRMHAKRIGGTAEHGISGNAGMILSMDYTVAGKHIRSEKIGVGDELQDTVDAIAGPEYFASTSSGGSDYSRKATAPVVVFGPRPIGTEIEISGTVEHNQFTDTSMLILFASDVR